MVVEEDNIVPDTKIEHPVHMRMDDSDRGNPPVEPVRGPAEGRYSLGDSLTYGADLRVDVVGEAFECVVESANLE